MIRALLTLPLLTACGTIGLAPDYTTDVLASEAELMADDISIEFEPLQYDGSCWLEPLPCRPVHMSSSSVPYTTHGAPEQQQPQGGHTAHLE